MLSVLKEIFTKNPDLFGLVNRIYRYIKKRPAFSTSEKYWEDRYRMGGNSGPGSYSNLADFKAEVINNFVTEHGIQSVIDFGCGDGNQLKYLEIDQYLGLDVSKTAIKRCKKKFRNDASRQFRQMEDYRSEKAELCLSLDVIFHLIEEPVFVTYMQRLFSASDKFVIIYASNANENNEPASHFKHRKFTDWIAQNQPDFELIRFIPNKYPYDGDEENTSVSDFYIFQKQ